jgi:uncharacterized protein YecE (DUF72 family)
MAERERPREDTSRIKIGTSGWSYKEWEKVFYPDSKTPKLSYYSSVFNTAEIDSTFYANPNPGMVLGWVRYTPRDFEFSVKLPQSITHEKSLDLEKGAEVDLLEFLDLINPLKEAKKLGPLLIQLPPSFSSAKANTLESFLDALPKKNNYKFAIEFRNKSWLRNKDELNELLRKYNVANTIVDEPLMPVDLTPTADFAFIRWHGKGMRPWYNYRYSESELDPWVDKVMKEVKHERIYGYFNNHFHGYAVENSLEFLKKIGEASEKQKEILKNVKSYLDEGPSTRHIAKSKTMRDKPKNEKATRREFDSSSQSTLAEFE